MGYESTIIVVQRSIVKMPNGKEWVHGEEIARVELCKMGYERVNGREFREVFTKPIDFNLYNFKSMDESTVYDDEEYRTDVYGAHCNMAQIDDVLQWLEASKVYTVDKYRRATLFHDILLTLKEHQDNYAPIWLVHVGH